MAVYRQIWMSFWTDPKILDDFTPEDRYFYLYLMTNPHTNLIGCYEISIKQISDETGYSKDTVERLLDRFMDYHKVVDYSKDTKELLLKNWSKYNWTKSEKLDKPLFEECSQIKNLQFRAFVGDLINSRDTVPIGYTYGMDTTVTDTVTVTDKYKDLIKEVIDYLNSTCHTHYTYNNKSYNSHIKARFNEGHTIDEFKRVIDIKAKAWLHDARMKIYLRPQTLFSTNFESYLNEGSVGNKNGHKRNDESEARRIYGDLLDKPFDGNDMPFV